MKKPMNKKRVLAFFAVLLVLVTVLCVPAFADASTDGYSTVDYLNSIPSRLRPAVASTVDYNPYVMVFDGLELYDNYSSLFNTYDGWGMYFYSYIGYGYDAYGTVSVYYEGYGDQVTVEIALNDGTPVYSSYFTVNATTQESFSVGFYTLQFGGTNADILRTNSYLPFMDCCPIYSVLQQKKAEAVVADVEEEAYQRGLAQGRSENDIGNAGAQLITSVVEAPVNVFTRMLNFEIFGVNVLGFVVAILSFALVIAILKKVV